MSYDVIIVGAGNAALCSAIAAAELGARVLVMEAAPESERGGNSAYTAGAMRVVYNGIDDLKKIIPDLSENDIKSTDFGSYSYDNYFDDMARVTEFRADPELVDILVRRSLDTLSWMQSHGIRFQPSYGRQAFKVNDQFKFWGGLAVEAWGGGPGLVESLYKAAQGLGVEIKYNTRARELITKSGSISGIRASINNGNIVDFETRAVILASGGFESNAAMRAQYLGPGWDLAKVRGTRYNMGDGINMALAVGAAPFGNWSGCHAVGWDMNAPEFGDLTVGDGFQKHSYPFGIMINAEGKRFLDEGADFRNYTYAKYGSKILQQTGFFSWQIFDSKVSHLLRDEYRIKQVTHVKSNNLADLASKMGNVNVETLISTIERFNSCVQIEIPFNPNIKDGRGTVGLSVPKSNWANKLDSPPYEAYAVTCGVTFTFGGLKIDSQCRVLDPSMTAIPGLYAAGELVGGLFYFNYPGGTGLTSGAVFGRLAGSTAAKL